MRNETRICPLVGDADRTANPRHLRLRARKVDETERSIGSFLCTGKQVVVLGRHPMRCKLVGFERFIFCLFYYSCYLCHFLNGFSVSFNTMLLKKKCLQSATSWNETKGVIRFTPMAEDRGKRLTCRAKNVNISRITESGVVVLEPLGQHSSNYFPDQYKEDSRHLVIHGKSSARCLFVVMPI